MNKFPRIAVVVGFISFLATGQNASATNYFNWGLETTNPSIGRFYGWHSGTTKDCTVSHSGSCSMRLDVKGNDGGNQQMGADIDQFAYGWNIVGSGALYYRWWMKIQPGFSWGSGTAKTKSSRVGTSAGQGYTGYLMSYGFLIGECDLGGCKLNNGGSNGADTSLYVPFNFRAKADGVWHEYIIKIKPNTSATCTAGVNCDAQLQAWVDGVSIGEYNNYKLSDKSSVSMSEFWGSWMASPYFQLNGTSSDGGVIYLDDFSTDDSWNSLFNNSGTTISAPSNLRIN